MRGEQTPNPRMTACGKGSPPLARGTVGTKYPVHIGRRITPACAGNSPPSEWQGKALGDHPRLRGEQVYSNLTNRSVSGSPPLARGTAVSLRVVNAERRITPACAGNRAKDKKKAHRGRDHPRLRGEQPCRAIARSNNRDHPRLRGEQKFRHGLFAPGVGSPPLARGTEHYRLDGGKGCRITPACAGNSCSAAWPMK